MNEAKLKHLKVGVFLICLLPAIRWLVLILTDNLGANPVEFLTRSSGTWTLVLLCITLTVSPLRRISGIVWILRLRRMLGLFTFFYVLLHLTTWVWFEHFFELSDMIKDVIKRPFITVGFTAMLLLWPLALTSNQYAMRRLGRNWGKLHRLVYVIAVLAILHYWWHKAGKNDLTEPMIYAAVVAALLLYRLVSQRLAAKPSASTLSSANKSSSVSR